ncbi:peptidase M23 [Archangium sp.]|uniref:peptidase M23 n=1 Tax=Archangium sp. TaxID=1872627 RepID=UPI002D3B0803|nr:peptidase M23 [Archangium sp.]HYO56020.1 peptidase M23 [Archangium sp.]
MNVKNMLYAPMALMASWASPSVALSVPVYGAICDTAAKVTSTTYYSCSGSSHTALDMSNGTCGEWAHRSMLGGSHYYQYYGGCANSCSGTNCSNPNSNYYFVTGANGWDFRQLHIWYNANSYSKTCDRCALGLVGGTNSGIGPQVHADNRQYATRKSAWYVSGGTTCGSSAYCGNIIGYATL